MLRKAKNRSEKSADQSRHRSLLEGLEVRRLFAAIVVNNLNDSGDGSFRDAIEKSNASTGEVDDITFDLPSGVQTIAPLSALPTITDPVNIYGVQSGGPLIELDGENITDDNIDGLDITAGNTLVQGFIINRFTGDGIGITGADTNLIQSNWIGLDNTGASASANGGDGVGIVDSNENTIYDNVISGNTANGVYIAGISESNKLSGNYIGTDITGASAVANGADGVLLANATDTIIDDNQGGNVISGNGANGIEIQATPGFAGSGNHITGNIIGMNLAMDDALPNGNDGILISAADNIVDGGNVISGNTHNGIEILANADFPNAQGNQISSNYIGVIPWGGAAFGNGGNGILMTAISPGQSGHNTTGGDNSVDGNVIAFNSLNGVSIAKGNPAGDNSGNAIVTNSIYSNVKLGIDLGNDGTTINDTKDVDSGPNDLQNTPIVTSVTANAGSNTITGTLNSTPSSQFTVQLFLNDASSKQGKTFLAAVGVTTDANGNASFTKTVSNTITTNDFVTATATDEDSNTSEFSAGVKGGTQAAPASTITIFGQTISGTEGKALTNVNLGYFTSSRGGSTANQFTVSINWGDGQTSAGTVQLISGKFQLYGSHTFAKYGQYNVVVNVKDNVNANTKAATDLANIADAALTATNKTFNATKNVQFSGVIGTFTDANPNSTAADFGTPSINWGDGHFSNATITKSNGVYSVSGKNTYASFGSFPVKVTVSDAGGSSATINSTAKVASPTITASPSNFTTTHGTNFSARVATFTDADPNATVGQFTITILWGDNTSSTFGSATKSGNVFNAFGSHKYANAGKFNVTVTVKDAGNSSTTVTVATVK